MTAVGMASAAASPSDARTTVDATVVYVAYGIEELDLAWIPDSTRVIVVHNDGLLRPAGMRHPAVESLHLGANVGFGAAVNAVMPLVSTGRLILANPDTRLGRVQFEALAAGGREEIITVNLRDDEGGPTAAVGAYPTPFTALLHAFRVGRWLPRTGRLRSLAVRLLGRDGRAHRDGLAATSGRWPLRDRWVSGAVVSFPTHLVRSVGGFDDRYFLYVEDIDLCERIAAACPSAELVVADVAAGTHTVGGTAAEGSSRVVARHRATSWHIYASRRSGSGWQLARALIGLRVRWCSRG